MANTPLGWYRWYPRDFLASSTVRKMSYTSQGIYRALLDLQWEIGVPLTYPEATLVLRLSENEQSEFQPFFDVCFPDGINAKLMEQRDKQARAIKAQSEAGKVGGKTSGKGRSKVAKRSVRGTSNQTETETETETKNKTGKKGLATWHEFAEMELPPSLNSVAGRDAWNKFCKHRSEKGAKLTSTNADALLKKLGRYPAMVAVGCLLQTVENGWQGIFPDKYNPPSITQSTPKSSAPVQGVDFINVELPNGDVAEFKPGFTADDESNPDAWFDRAKWGQA